MLEMHGCVKIRPLHTVFSLHNKLGGAVHATLRVCQYLADAGQPAEVAATTGPGDGLDYLPQACPAVPTHLFDRSFPVKQWNSAKFQRWVLGALVQFDLVEIHSIFGGITWHAARSC